MFLVAVGENPWTVNLALNGQSVEFCIDTGAEVTVIPERIYRTLHNVSLSIPPRILCGPSQSKLGVCGCLTGRVVKGDLEKKQEIYVVKDLHKPLLGRPAIEALGLVARVGEVQQEQNPEQLFPGLFTGLGKLQGEYTIKLRDGAKPFSLTTPRRVAIPLIPAVKTELERMEAMEVISRVEEPTEWCAGMVVVSKPKGKVRICVDLTQLNPSVCRECHPLPDVEQTLAQIAGAQVFSKLDSNSGFWQIPLAKESSLLTTFITPFGRYKFNRLPFGISSAPEHFQHRMTDLLRGLEGVICLIDDVLVHGRTQEEHDERLALVLQRLLESGMTLNKEKKCKFSCSRINFLGQTLSGSGIQPDPEKVAVIQKLGAPTDVHGFRRFLGMANQLIKFTPNMAEMTRPLRNLLLKENLWCWEEPQKSAFAKVKSALIEIPTLALFNPQLETTVSADASSFRLGAVLLQKQSAGDICPVTYISRSMSPTEQSYAQIEKEALALTWACERFADYLIGISFHIQTDHKPLVPLLSTKLLDELPIRVQRFQMRLMRYDFTISHIPGKDLVTADTLLRAPVAEGTSLDQSLQEEVNAYVQLTLESLPASEGRLAEIREAQDKDETCQQIAKYCQSGWPLKNKLFGPVKKFYSVATELAVAQGILMRGNRLVIPTALQVEVL